VACRFLGLEVFQINNLRTRKSSISHEAKTRKREKELGSLFLFLLGGILCLLFLYKFRLDNTAPCLSLTCTQFKAGSQMNLATIRER
jgi:hypothetical protein